MPKVAIATMEQAVPIPPPPGDGAIVSRALFAGARHPIHLHAHALSANAHVAMAGDLTNLALFVWKGSVVAGGALLRELSGAVIERGASLRLQAGEGGATVLAFNLGRESEIKSGGGRVHLLPRDRVPRSDALDGQAGMGGAMYADAQCPTCSVWLHEVSCTFADKETEVHSHSEDEVIFVYAGSIRLGNRLYGPGTALAIAADTKYGFHTGPDGLAFVNFRGTSPTVTMKDGSLHDEAELWRGLLGQPEYLEPAG